MTAEALSTAPPLLPGSDDSADRGYGYLRQGRTLYQTFEPTRKDMREVPILDVRHHDVQYRLPA